MIRQLTAGSPFILVLLCIAALMVAGDFISTLFTVFYSRIYYPRRLRPRYDPSYTPRCCVVIPCKGIAKDLEDNLRTFLVMDYPDYETLFVVESETDPAAAVIARVVHDQPRARLVVAGYATRCAQKNFNMLAAIAQAGPHDIYVFADADIGPGKGWLREMVLPFSDGAVTATTAFRWLHRRTVTTRELSHSYMNMFIYTLVSTASFVKSIGLWGGSMALRRTDFDALGVAKRWAETVVDDISLSEIIMKNRRKTVLVPAAVTRTDDFIGSVRASILWFERQAMFLKAYHFISWAWLAPIIYVTWCLMLWLPFALVLSMVTRRGFLSLAGGPALLVYAGQYLTVLLYLFLGPVPGFFRFLLFWPLLRMTHFVSYTRSVLTNVITWSGIRYHLGRGGIVTRVERPPAP